MARKSFSSKQSLPDRDTLRSLLDYNPETGKLFWKHRIDDTHEMRMWNTAHAGKEAFTYLSSDGYLQGRLFNRGVRSHRVIWKLVFDIEPLEIDHINGVRTDNRLSNLRSVSSIENRRNAKRRKDNSSGTPGVYWEEQHQMWRARIRVEGKQLHLGRFADKDDAVTARKNAELSYGFHANHGRET